MNNNELLENLISKRLKELRVSNDYTYAKVALELNINRETIRRYEKKPSIMTVDTFLRLLDLYGYETKIFFDEIYGKMP